MKNIFKTLKTNSKKGFTLVEMIIVIVIIAILAAIAIPAMKGYIDDANEATAIANCRTALTASEAVAPMLDAETADDFSTEITKLLGDSCDLADPVVVEGEPTTGTATGTFSDGELVIEYTAGAGTDKITWEDSDGNMAVWEAGMSAPEIDSDGDGDLSTQSE